MERTIGNLGEEIKQPSKPYANLSQRGVRRSQVNALKSMIPDLEKDTNRLPRGAVDLGNGYVLLRARDETAREIRGDEERAVLKYFETVVDDLEIGPHPRITRWSRLRLPNGQIAHSAWKENLKAIGQVRIARQVAVCICFHSLNHLTQSFVGQY
jgi:hypothetical protein